jgi:hypothetical protein
LERIRKRCKTKLRVNHWQTELKKIGVNQPAILYAFKRIKITIKRNNFVIEKEIDKKR